MSQLLTLVLGFGLFGASALAQSVKTGPPPQTPTAQAILSCNIDYTSPDGKTVVKIVDQQYKLPIQSGLAYYDRLALGDRLLDYSAYNSGTDKMVSVTLWKDASGGTLCDVTEVGSASCDYKGKADSETASISCHRVD